MKRFLVCTLSVLFTTLAHAHGPQVGPGCGDLSKFMNVHCHSLNSSGCCAKWVYDHAPVSTQSFPVSGTGRHCTRAVAAQLAVNAMLAQCAGTVSNRSYAFSGIRTPSCSIEPHDSGSFSSNGVYDIIEASGTCTQ